MKQERANAVTLRGSAFTLIGPELKEGEQAPDFTLLGNNMKDFSRENLEGSVRVLSVVPSLDTPVCDAMTRRFNQQVSGIDGAHLYTISMDLPFAQKRWCETQGIDNVTMLSDHRDGSFGEAYGTLIKEMRLESRAVFVLDGENRIQHVEYVTEVADQPDYDKAMDAVRRTTGR